jgi:hypothetical protein
VSVIRSSQCQCTGQVGIRYRREVCSLAPESALWPSRKASLPGFSTGQQALVAADAAAAFAIPRGRTATPFEAAGTEKHPNPSPHYPESIGPADPVHLQAGPIVNAEVLAVADELSRGTIDIVPARSGLELGIEALMRGLQP